MRLRFLLGLVAVLSAVGFLPSSSVSAQEKGKAVKEKKLTIGSEAPSLDIAHWVQDGNGKFSEVTKFESGKVYIVEFWATWCRPCISSMPHLVEIQHKYQDNGVQIISVSREPLETVEKFLERTVRGEKEKTYKELTSAYCLTTDPDGSVSKDYMRAAGQNGIPTAFIVGKDGHVEWIGHPARMDQPLKAIVEGNWDREKFATEFKKAEIVKGLSRKLRNLVNRNPKKAIEFIDAEMGKTENAEFKSFSDQMKLAKLHCMVLTNASPEETEQYLEKVSTFLGENPRNIYAVGSRLANAVRGKRNLVNKKAMSKIAEMVLGSADKASKSIQWLVYDAAVQLHYAAGNLDLAIKAQELGLKVPAPKNVKTKMEKFLKKIRSEQDGGSQNESKAETSDES